MALLRAVRVGLSNEVRACAHDHSLAMMRCTARQDSQTISHCATTLMYCVVLCSNARSTLCARLIRQAVCSAVHPP
eukprot:4303485-Pleurochrysis_carterae.AAC.2